MCFQLPINSPEIRSTSNHMIISNNISIFIPDEAWPRPLRHLKYIQCEHILPIISQTGSKLTKPEKQRWTAITITGNTSSRLSSSTISTNSNARELLTYKEKKKGPSSLIDHLEARLVIYTTEGVFSWKRRTVASSSVCNFLGEVTTKAEAGSTSAI